MRPIDALLLLPVAGIYGVQIFSWNVPVSPGLVGVGNALFLLWLVLGVRR